jgi:hypothetical protein
MSLPAVSYQILLATALFVLFGPPSFFLGRFEESVLAGGLGIGALLIAVATHGIERDRWLPLCFTFVCLPLIFYIDLIRNQSPYNSVAFLFPFFEGGLFYVAARYWEPRKVELMTLVSGIVATKALLILYKYGTGQFLGLELEFSDVSATIEVAGFLLQRPFDAAVALFGVLSFYSVVTEVGWRRTYFSSVTLLCSAVAIISFSRSLWLAMFVAFVAIIARESSRIFALTSGFAAVVLVTFLALNLRGPLDPYIDLLYQRIEWTNRQADSALGNLRNLEVEHTVSELSKGSAIQLLIGLGPAGSIATFERDGAGINYVDKQYIHNYHILVLAKLGILGFLALYIPVVCSARRGGGYTYFVLALALFLVFQPVVLAFHLFALVGTARWFGRKLS